jgi:hypothetical protein
MADAASQVKQGPYIDSAVCYGLRLMPLLISVGYVYWCWVLQPSLGHSDGKLCQQECDFTRQALLIASW